MKRLHIVSGPSLTQLQVAAAQLAVSEKGAAISLPFTVQEHTEEGVEKAPEVETTYPIAGFYRYEGVSSPWSLTVSTTGEGAPEQLTKLHFYPTDGKGHVEIFDDDD